MNDFIKEFKMMWYMPNNTIIRLIVLNVGIWVLLNVVSVFSTIFQNFLVYDFLQKIFFIPPAFEDFLFRPWSIFSYSFAHEGFWHILMNMLMLYWFGQIVQEFMGNIRLLGFYVWGALGGGILYLLAYNFIPFFISIRPEIGMIGASAAIYSVITGAATFLPRYSMHLLFIGAVQLRWIAVVVIFLSFIGSVGSNAGGNLAHLGGALVGFLMASQYKKGIDWSVPIAKLLALFDRKPKDRRYQKSTKKGERSRPEQPNQEIIDKILDKISASGYESLTSEEKQILFKASQKKV